MQEKPESEQRAIRFRLRLLVGALLVAGLMLLTMLLIQPAIQASSLMKEGQYLSAAEIYDRIGMKSKANSARYALGQQLLEQKKYTEAADILLSLGEYEDAVELFHHARAEEARILAEAGEWDAAQEKLMYLVEYDQYIPAYEILMEYPVLKDMVKEKIFRIGNQLEFDIDDHWNNYLSFKRWVIVELKDGQALLLAKYSSTVGTLDLHKLRNRVGFQQPERMAERRIPAGVPLRDQAGYSGSARFQQLRGRCFSSA